MSSYTRIGPSGHIYRIDADYVEGSLEGSGEPWRGWRIRYKPSGEVFVPTIYLEGDEAEEPRQAFVVRQVDHHYVNVVLPAQTPQRWQREVLDPQAMTDAELRAELEHDGRIATATHDSRRRMLVELRCLELLHELERRRLPIPEEWRRLL